MPKAFALPFREAVKIFMETKEQVYAFKNWATTWGLATITALYNFLIIQHYALEIIVYNFYPIISWNINVFQLWNSGTMYYS